MPTYIVLIYEITKTYTSNHHVHLTLSQKGVLRGKFTIPFSKMTIFPFLKLLSELDIACFRGQFKNIFGIILCRLLSGEDNLNMKKNISTIYFAHGVLIINNPLQRGQFKNIFSE